MLGDTMRRRHAPARNHARGEPVRWIRWILAALGSIVFCFGTGYAVAVFVLFPVPEQGAHDSIAVPRLVGRELAAAERELAAAGLRLEGTTEIPHASEPVGFVIAQTPLAGQHLRSGGVVRVALSAGRGRVAVPDVAGLPVADGAALVERLGFLVNRREETAGGAPGIVLRTEPAPGTVRELPAAVTLYVSAAPAPAEGGLSPDSTAPLPAPGAPGAW